MISFARSANIVSANWSNRGFNSWTNELFTIPLSQGVSTYNVPQRVVNMQDVYLRVYQLGTIVNQAPAFATTNLSDTVTVTWPNNGLQYLNWIQIVVPIAIGGIVLQGFYQVQSVIDGNNFTITAADDATSTTSGGVVPQFATTAANSNVTVTLANHGYLSGQSFIVQVPTFVGGLTLNGSYTISSVTTNTFVINAGYNATSSTSGYENDGDAQLAGQFTNSTNNEGYTDRILGAISRTDWASYPNKAAQAPPNVYWFNKLINPQVTVWQVPDSNGPYELRFYANTRIEDMAPKGSQTLNIPFQFYEAFCADTAAHLAMKWAPDRAIALKAYAKEVWAEASAADDPIVSTFISPNVQSYFP